MVAAGGEEEGVRHPEDDVEPEDVDVEMVNALDVGCPQMDVPDLDPGVDRPRAALLGDDPVHGLIVHLSRMPPL